MKFLLVSDIKLPYLSDEREALAIAKNKLKRAGASLDGAELSVYKRSVDARDRNAISFVYSVMASGVCGVDRSKMTALKISEISDPYAELSFSPGSEALGGRVLVVGMGPCGLFAAYLLAKHGYRPIIIDRGGSIDERVKAVSSFYKTGSLDTETNVQFGAGGAGTFSDGKLVTRIKDPSCSYVLKTFVDHGADKDILKNAKPHIGTDILRSVVDNMLSEIVRLGGEVIYNCRLDGITESGSYCIAKTSKGDISCGAVVLAVGHSARDTYEYLLSSGFSILPKSFSVGVRIEHLQEDVDRSLYGDRAGDIRLPRGEYALSNTKGERGVYTFCMCPGGYVMAATSEEGRVVVNGMSEKARDGKNANSAMLVSVTPEDFSFDVRKAIAFQRKLESDAYILGASNYNAPVLTVGDFIDGKCINEPSKVIPTYMDGKYTVANIASAMPRFLCDGLLRGLSSFSKKMECFNDRSAVLSAFETRTSAPLRIVREPDMIAKGRRFIYPCGEGAGYAGGITSAACDGINVAKKIIERFKPQN